MGNTESWKPGSKEIALYAPITGPSNASSLQLQIPKLFVNKDMGLPRVSPGGLSSSCLINDNACKPSVSRTIRTQNYITVPKHANSDFEYPYLCKGDRLYVEVIDGNWDTMKVTNLLDPSHLIPC